MRDFSNWSLNLGRFYGVQVRLHAFFLFFSVLALYLATRDPSQDLGGRTVLSLVILLLSVLAHEIGHTVAAFRVGGSADQIVIGPLGGLAPPSVPHEPQHELITALAGPLMNFLIWLAMGPVLLVAGVNLLGLLHPLSPEAVIEGPMWLVALKLTFWLNWLLVLVNLLPVFPLDGGRVLRALLWPAVGYRRAVLAVTWGAKVTAVAMCMAAWMLGDYFPQALVPAWVALLILAIFLFFSARQEASRVEEQELEEELFSYDFSQGYTSLERSLEPPRPSGPGILRRWFVERRRARLRRQQVAEQDEERQVDAILARVHTTGMAGLTAKERAVLERVSARYRNRQRSQAD